MIAADVSAKGPVREREQVPRRMTREAFDRFCAWCERNGDPAPNERDFTFIDTAGAIEAAVNEDLPRQVRPATVLKIATQAKPTAGVLSDGEF